MTSLRADVITLHSSRQIADHIVFGYFNQLISFGTLTIVGIVLPNSLGVGEFAKYSSAMGLLMLSGGIFNEAICLRMVDVIGRSSDRVRALPAVYVRACLDHFILSLGLIAVMWSLITIIGLGQDKVGLSDIGMQIAAVLVMSLYVPAVAALTIAFRNRWVSLMSATNGLLSFIVPLWLHLAQADVRWAPFAIYAFSAITVITLMKSIGIINLRSLRSGGPVGLHRDTIYLVSPSLFRLSLAWIPVVAFAFQEEDAQASAYRIAMAIIFGAMSLIPFPRHTMASLALSVEVRQQVEKLSVFALICASFIGFSVYAASGAIVSSLYTDEFSYTTSLLRRVSVCVVLLAFADAGFNWFFHMKRQKYMLPVTAGAIAVGFIGVYLKGLAAFPVVASGGLAVCLLMTDHRGVGRILARALPSVVAVISVILILFYWRGFSAIVGLGLIVCALGLNSNARSVLTRMINGLKQ